MAWMNRLRNLIGSRELERGLDEELRFHLDARIADNIKGGMSPAEAREDALRRFGNPSVAKEQTRDADLFPSLDALARDLRCAIRSLRRTPAFTIVAILVLALGIGANTAVFTVVNSVLLRPLPFPDPGRLFVISFEPREAAVFLGPAMADFDYVAFRAHQQQFESTAVYGQNPVTLTGAGEPMRAAGVVVTPDFLQVLRVNPVLGRGFLPDEGQPGRNNVVLLSDKFWHERFAADRAVIGRGIRLDGIRSTIIGVMPPGFSFPASTDLWIPTANRAEGHNSFSRPVIGRMKPGITLRQAQAAFEALSSSLPIYPDAKRSDYETRIDPLHQVIAAKARISLLVFSGAVAFVLLIACANVANLLLIRATSRRHEIAVRAALGASRWRLIRQLLTESLVTSLAGGAAGVLLAVAVVRPLVALAPAGYLPSANEIGLDFRVLAFAFGLAVVTGLVFGLAPAIEVTRRDLRQPLSETSRTTTGNRQALRSALVVAEVALALVLLTGAGLLLRSLRHVLSVDPGFDRRDVVTATVDLPDSSYRGAVEMRAFHQRVLAQLGTLPGIEAVGAVDWMPFGDEWARGDFQMEPGYHRPPGFDVFKPVVSPGYFAAMGIRLLRGRAFSEHDSAGSPGVIIVSESVARSLWPGENPIGRRISMDEHPAPTDWLTVVGVVADVRQAQLTDAPSPAIYQPYTQSGSTFFLGHMSFVMRTPSSPAALAPTVRAIFHRIDPDQPVQSIAAMSDAIAGTIAEPRFLAQVIGAFSLMALLLSAIGLYGVLAFSIAERTREIGIRMAMGASSVAVVRMVLRRTLLLAGTGVLIGSFGALGVTRVLRTFLFEITPTDPATFIAVAVFLLAVALVAGLLPARRAYSVDPLVALRYE